MKKDYRKWTLTTLTLLLLVVFSACGNMSLGKKSEEDKGKNYPDKPVTMIIPYSAGGTTDLTGRKLAISLEKELGESIVVVNQPGASGSIATKTVLDAKPDGYTIFYTADSLGTQRVMGLSDFSYDDFSPIMAVVNDPKVIVVAGDSKYESAEQLFKDMKERKGKVKMSYTGPGGSGHVQALIYNELGYDMALTAYSGGKDCILAVLGGQVDFTNANLSTVRSYIDSGDLRLLAVSAKDRLEAYPEVPSLPEFLHESKTYLDMPFTPLSLVVAKDCPDYVKTRLREASLKAVEDEDWQDFVRENSLEKLYEKYKNIEEIETFYKDWQSAVCWLLWDAGVAKNEPSEYGIERGF